MDKELLEALSQMLDEKLDNKLDEKLNPIKKELNEINKKLDGITEQTADLVEFRNEILNKIAKMKKKNIAVEILNRALKDYVDQVGKENVVMMEKFSTRFQKIVASYNERTSVEDIEKIIFQLLDNWKNTQ